MSLLTGFNHAALLTASLPRLIEFYSAVFEANIVFEETSPEFSHAMLRIGDASVLHAIEVPNSTATQGGFDIFKRGHVDHLGLNVSSLAVLNQVRHRLVERGATGGIISDLGPQVSFWFKDPDGMLAEVCWIRDHALRGFHSPEPYVREPQPGID